jgi:polar amino acid transport system substrate-binding protein
MIARFLTIIAAAAALSSCGREQKSAGTADLLNAVTAAKTVRVGVKTDTPPFGMRIGEQYAGFDVELALALSRKLGIEKVEFVPVTSTDRDDKLVAGEVDMVIASMTITRYRDKKIDFSIPYFQDGQALLVAADSPIGSYLDLSGRKVGCVQGSTSSWYIKQVAPDCVPEIVPNFAALTRALNDGKVEAITSDMLILIGLMKAQANPKQWRIAGDRFTTEPYGIAVPENQSNWRDAINQGLMELWEDGSWQRIAVAWFGPGAKFEHKIDFAITPYPK